MMDIRDNYALVSGELEKEAVRLDFEQAADAVGGRLRDAESVICLEMLGETFEMHRKGLFVDDEYCEDSWAKIIVYDYLQRQGRQPLTGDRVGLGHFPVTASYVKAFHAAAERDIAAAFGPSLDGLKRRCAGMGGEEAPDKLDADFSCVIPLLPRVPLTLCFWEADEDFGASCKLFVDANAENHIDIEYLAYLVQRFAARLIEV
ncbi:MAG: DUF3786 domain-containing protein [Deltaproteobacteria bacterium]|nr:DUF3786 domain-containing protein [Deltaproteobacteria bacterium]